MKDCKNHHERIWFYGDVCPLCEAYIEIDQLKDQACASIIKVMDLEKQIATLRVMKERLQNEVFVTAGIGSK